MQTERTNSDLAVKVILGAREYGIGSLLFRHAVGAKLGVSATDMECLGAIFFKGITTPSEVAKYTGLSTGATTAMLDRLEKSGLIQRSPNPNDRRSLHISVVKKAARKVGPLFASAREAQNKIVSGYSNKELTILDDFFNKSSAMWEEERNKLLS